MCNFHSEKNMNRQSLQGMSLVELIVAMSILTMVMGGMSLFFSRIWQTQAFTLQTGQASFVASRGVEGVVDLIRNARTGADGSFPVVTATPTEFTFFADTDHDDTIERVHIFYNTGSTPKAMQYGITEPTAATPPTYPASDGTVYTLANYVVNDASEPVFTYYDSANSQLSATPTVSTVRMVNVSILINTGSGNVNDIAISSFASLRNLWGK